MDYGPFYLAAFWLALIVAVIEAMLEPPRRY